MWHLTLHKKEKNYYWYNFLGRCLKNWRIKYIFIIYLNEKLVLFGYKLFQSSYLQQNMKKKLDW